MASIGRGALGFHQNLDGRNLLMRSSSFSRHFLIAMPIRIYKRLMNITKEGQ